MVLCKLLTPYSLLSILSVGVFTATAAPSPSIQMTENTNQDHHEHAKRGGTCAFPNYDGMVAVQKGGSNGGWAMSPDQECSYGSWCPYACKPGQLMGQWDPSATTYSYPKCQNGGLYCDSNGNLQKPNSDKDYCYDGKGTVIAKNNANSGDVAFCQTVLPGNEAMLIPTLVGSGSKQTLAVPGTDYWASTASHYYVNAPGVSVEDACQWGSSANPQGN
ncbi:AIC_G0042850.mRNA.1.CDS.1 [Saccharomyces cerevisiae]|nr:AIC_G0042850.mRNA.1.CDS.1 [Saccharomyces cerevisiae]CAI6847266.1 AIC_G0042850.mRNA.1.CDS.1 [Saccharomyces cerevisiae]